MANIKYLTLEGLTHFKSKIDKTFAAHLTGDRTKEGVNIFLRNNVKTGDAYEVLDSISIPAVSESGAGVMTTDQLVRLNASATAAFSNIQVGSTKITANSVSDTLTVTSGSGINVSANNTNDTITISHADTSTVTTSAIGPSSNQTQIVETDLQFTVPQITVDGFGHVTALTDRTITVKDTNTKTTKEGHYEPKDTDGEVKKIAGTDVTTFGNTITFIQAVTIDNKKHLTGATFGSLTLSETQLSKDTTVGSGNCVSDINVNGHQITLTKTTLATPNDVSAALASAKEYADALELRKFDFKGDLPSTATAAVVGDVYRIATAGTYLGATYEVGDFVLCVTPGTTANAACWASLNTNWSVSTTTKTLTASSQQTLATVGGVDIKVNVPDFSLNGHSHPDLAQKEHTHTLNPNVGDDGIVKLTISKTTPTLGQSATGFTITASHKAYSNGAKSLVPTGSLSWGQTIQIPSVEADKYGHINGGELVSFTMPDNPNTDTKVTSVGNHYTTNGYTAITTAGLYKIKTDAAGHITGQTAVVKTDITALGIPGQDTTYGATNPITLSNGKFGLSYITETTESNTISSATYASYNKLGLKDNKLCAVIDNITIADIDALFA